jgi:hypothetical protein
MSFVSIRSVLFPDSNKKTTQRFSDRSERNVKFAGESREERNNRRNREDRPSAAPADFNRCVLVMPFVEYMF